MPRTRGVDAPPSIVPAGEYVLVRADDLRAVIRQAILAVALASVAESARKRQRDAQASELTKYLKALLAIQLAARAAGRDRPNEEEKA